MSELTDVSIILQLIGWIELEVIFLYNRLLGLCRDQLKALRIENYDLMEDLTLKREILTAKICSILDNEDTDFDDNVVNSKTREITQEIFEVDEEIKEILLKELFARAEDLSRIKLVE